MDQTFALSALSLALLAWALPKVRRRLQLSLAKHPSLAGHSRLARRIAGWIPGYAYDEARFAAVDGAPEEIAQRRRDALRRLSLLYAQRYARTAALTAVAREGLSDLQFTGAYRVPFPFSALIGRHLRQGSFVARAGGVTVEDLDGNRFHDLTGSN